IHRGRGPARFAKLGLLLVLGVAVVAQDALLGLLVFALDLGAALRVHVLQLVTGLLDLRDRLGLSAGVFAIDAFLVRGVMLLDGACPALDSLGEGPFALGADDNRLPKGR